MRSFLAELLEEEGFDVTTASNGFSALRLAAQHRPRLMLLDVLMPELRGGDVLHELRASATTRDMAVVIVTGNAHQLPDAQRAEADAIVHKPFEVPELIATVNRAVLQAANRHAEVSPVESGAHKEPVMRNRGPVAPRTRGRR
jgi:CheY-like chemotaxis protein